MNAHMIIWLELISSSVATVVLITSSCNIFEKWIISLKTSLDFTFFQKLYLYPVSCEELKNVIFVRKIPKCPVAGFYQNLLPIYIELNIQKSLAQIIIAEKWTVNYGFDLLLHISRNMTHTLDKMLHSLSIFLLNYHTQSKPSVSFLAV